MVCINCYLITYPARRIRVGNHNIILADHRITTRIDDIKMYSIDNYWVIPTYKRILLLYAYNSVYYVRVIYKRFLYNLIILKFT